MTQRCRSQAVGPGDGERGLRGLSREKSSKAAQGGLWSS